MRAIVYDRYGPPDVLDLREVDTPEPKDDEVRIRVRAASVNRYDWHFMTGLPYIGRPMMGGLRSPSGDRLGSDVSGVVETVGTAATRFEVGDDVFGMSNGAIPDHPQLELGTFADYVCVSEGWLERIPDRLTAEQAAAIPTAAITALQGLRHIGLVQPGQKILVNGASGGVGTFAVQIATALGAEVTGVCSTPNVEMVRSIGADDVVDYTRDDVTRQGTRFDLILDNVGNRTLSDMRRVLAPEGMYLASFGQPDHRWVGPFAALMRMAVTNRFASQTLIELNQVRNGDDLAFLCGLVDAGALTPVIDRTYELSDVPDAMRYVGEGHARGKVVITV